MPLHAPSATASSRRAVPRRYHGWRVVGAAFLIAFFGWGLGFYGPGIYLVALTARTGWPLAAISPAVTVYYLIGALLIVMSASAFARFGSRVVVMVGALALAAGVMLLTRVGQPWQVYGAFAVMAFGWAAMSGAAVNIVIAPWFQHRRGAAVSLALNGASAGGVVMAPLLVLLLDRFGFTVAVAVAVAGMLVVLLPVVALVLRPRRVDEHEPGAPAAPAGLADPASAHGDAWPLSRILRSPAFGTIAAPFALGLLVQVGILTHQVAYLAPIVGRDGAGWAVSATTLAAVVGRLAAGLFVDRVDRRLATGTNFALQIVALALLATAPSPALVLLGCVLFGLGVGNLITLPGLIVQQEFPAAQFARIVSLMTAIGQVTFAFGPALLGYLRTANGSYTMALAVCVLIDLAAAALVVAPVCLRRRRS